MKKLLIIILSFLLISCGNEDLENYIVMENKDISQNKEENLKKNNIKLKELTRVLKLENKEYTFEYEKENGKMKIFYRDSDLILSTKKDLELFLDFLDYGLKYDNLVIDKINFNISHKIYNEEILSNIILKTEGRSFFMNILIDDVGDFKEITENNLEDIYSHNSKIWVGVVTNFIGKSTKEQREKIINLENKNSQNLYLKFPNWESNNSLTLWGRDAFQKIIDEDDNNIEKT